MAFQERRYWSLLSSRWRFFLGAGVFLSAVLLIAFVVLRPEHLFLEAIRAVVGVVFLTLVPGYLIRELLGVDESSTVHALLNSVGLSLLFCVSIAVLIDVGLAGMVQSLQGVTFTVAALTVTGLMGGYVLTQQTWDPNHVSSALQTSKQYWQSTLLLTAVPLLAVSGTHFVNTTGDNRLALVFIVVTASMPLVLSTGVVSESIEPYAIFCVALGVLYSTTLISPHIWGWDTHYEYGTALYFQQQGHWQHDYGSSLTPLLTITVLSGLFSEVTGLSLVSVFKIIYPVLFALMPVGLYWLFARLFEDRSISMLAPFFVIFYYGFFKVIPGKQAIGEVFFVLALMALLAQSLSQFQRRLLAVAFFCGIVFSHYATSALFVLFLGLGYAGVTVLRRTDVLRPLGEFTLLQPRFILLSAVIWLMWFGITAGGLNLDRAAAAGLSAVEGLFGQGSDRSGIAYATRSYGSALWTLHKGIYAVVLGLGGLGILRELIVLYREKSIDLRGEFAIIGVVVYAVVGSSAVMTYNLGFDRMLQIGLLILAPFAVIGGRWSAMRISERMSTLPTLDSGQITPVLAVFLLTMFSFSSGGIFVVAGEEAPEYSINLDTRAGFPVYSEDEVTTTRWASQNLPSCAAIGVYGDREKPNSRDGLLLSEVISTNRIETIPPDQTTTPDVSYVYVSDRPLDRSDDLGAYIDPESTPLYSEVLAEAPVVYSRGPARIYQVGSEPNCSAQLESPIRDD